MPATRPKERHRLLRSALVGEWWSQAAIPFTKPYEVTPFNLTDIFQLIPGFKWDQKCLFNGIFAPRTHSIPSKLLQDCSSEMYFFILFYFSITVYPPYALLHPNTNLHAMLT